MNRGFLVSVGTSLVLLCGPALGDKPAREIEKARDEVYSIWDVDSMIEQAANNVARRYNLNAEQTAFTQRIMRERVRKFLTENEEAIWPLVRDLARQQLTGEVLDPETAKRIGQAALPIVEKAKKAIYESNAEWGNILSEEQKRLHEFDLREMEGQFTQINNNFQDYASGRPKPNPMFPEYEPKPEEPPRPKRPPSVVGPAKRQEHLWNRYVREFIRKYELDPGQRETVNSILRELKQRADDHRKKKDKEFKAVEKRLNEAVAKGDLKKRMAAKREETALNKPIKAMFQELKDRLDKIPTPAQKKKYQEIVKAKRAKTRQPTKSKAKTPPTSRDKEDK